MSGVVCQMCACCAVQVRCVQLTSELRAVIAGTALSSQNIVFFSIRGPRALADQLSGGDYDGDRFLVISNPAIVDAFITQSEPWEEPQTPQSGRKAVAISEYCGDNIEKYIDNGLATHWLTCVRNGGNIGRVRRPTEMTHRPLHLPFASCVLNTTYAD